MAKTDNLNDFLTDIANSIRTKTQTSEPINAQDFSDKILNIQSGGTLKNYLDAMQSAEYLFKNYEGTSVDNIIQYSDTENVTSTSGMFQNCKKLTTIPLLDTNNVTDMGGMFSDCSLTTVPLLDTSKVTNMDYMFYNCGKLTAIPQFNTSNVVSMDSMLYDAAITTIPLLDTSKVTTMHSMFYRC